MGCNSSSMNHQVRKNSKGSVVSLNHQIYANVKKRVGMPSSYKEDGYDMGLRIKDAIGGIYSLYVGTSRKTGEKVSIKEVFLINKADTELESRIVQEVAILSRLSTHSGCPMLRELFVAENQGVYIVMNYIDTFRLKNFVDLRARTTSLSLAETRKVFKALLSIVIHAHEQSVTLRALNLDNVMALKKTRRPSKDTSSDKSCADFDIKLADLSQAVDFGDSTNITDHPLFDWNNQLSFVAPECALKLPYTAACDIWSLGVILFTLISGELPFSVDDYMDRAKLIDKIKNTEFSFGGHQWATIRKDIKTLIQSMLTSDPLQRATAAEIRRNEWILNG